MALLPGQGPGTGETSTADYDLNTLPPAETRPRFFSDPALGFICLALGVATIALASYLEERYIQNVHWAGAIFVADGDPYWEGTLPAKTIRIPSYNFPEVQALLKKIEAYSGDDALGPLRLDETERFVSIDAPWDIFASVLASGRLPQPGKQEVLAGYLARIDSFRVGRNVFTVSGRLTPAVAGLGFAYITADGDKVAHVFTKQTGATTGWLDPHGVQRVREAGLDPEQIARLSAQMPLASTSKRLTWMGIGGLLLVAVGGALIQLRLFYSFSHGRRHPLTSIFRSMRKAPFTLSVLHLALYGAFFVMMVAATRFPLDNLRLHSLIGHAFSEGDLAYIGAAYESGNILQAAFNTFFHNYLVATVALTILPSIFIPYLGLLKTLISFVMVGFVMSPMWVGMMSGYVYHSITMTLELEGYIIACFVVCECARNMFSGLGKILFRIQNKDEDAGWIAAFQVTLSGTLLVGCMLGVAALFEASTLILLR